MHMYFAHVGLVGLLWKWKNINDILISLDLQKYDIENLFATGEARVDIFVILQNHIFFVQNVHSETSVYIFNENMLKPKMSTWFASHQER